MINLMRGSGLKGLVGIPQIRGKIIRPLLPFTRMEILNYANEYNIKWREDASNANLSDKIDEIIRLINLPCFVKASKSGSSYGVFKAYNKNELELCITKSLEFDEKVLIEEFIEDSKGELLDYKFFCFKGKVKMIQIDYDLSLIHI